MGHARWFWIVAFAIPGTACGGESIGQVSVRDHPRTPPTSNGTDGGDVLVGTSDGGVSDTAVPDGGSLETRSGSRLTLTYGYSNIPGVWDEKRKTSCRPLLAADGAERCLPAVTGRVVFTDVADRVSAAETDDLHDGIAHGYAEHALPT